MMMRFQSVVRRGGARVAGASPRVHRARSSRGVARVMRGVPRVAAVADGDIFAPEEVDEGSYIVVGVSQCYRKDDEGQLEVALQIEPINATSLECMSLGAATSFKYVAGLTLREAKAMAPASLPEDLRAASFCDDFDLKVELCARTWRRPHPQSALMDIVPLGSCKTDFNFDATTYKRILNVVHEVTDEDNIKQDKSIDVYDRFKDEDKDKSE